MILQVVRKWPFLDQRAIDRTSADTISRQRASWFSRSFNVFSMQSSAKDKCATVEHSAWILRYVWFGTLSRLQEAAIKNHQLIIWIIAMKVIDYFLLCFTLMHRRWVPPGLVKRSENKLSLSSGTSWYIRLYNIGSPCPAEERLLREKDCRLQSSLL